ncbi:MAG: LysR family transcriptional regulator, partial [Verrucomicrobiota bacterium]
RVHVSQPSLSQQISKLEDEVGGSLFIRSRDGVVLSELGKEFLPHAKAIMAEVESTEDFIYQSHGGVQGPIRIGAIPTIAPYLLPGIMKKITSIYADARYEIIEDTTDSLIEKLRMGGIDFALMSPPTKIDEDADHRLIRKDELLLTLPRNHPLRASKSIELKQLKTERLVLLQDAHCLSRQSEGYCKASGIKADVTIRSSQIDTLLGIVELGLGFTFTPQIAVDFHSHRKVIYRSLSKNPYFREIHLYWMRRRLLSTTQQSIIKCFGQL